jgi:hypothetical protein
MFRVSGISAWVLLLVACGSREERCGRIIDGALGNLEKLQSIRTAIESPLRDLPDDAQQARLSLIERCVATRVSEICLDCIDQTGTPVGCPTCPVP